MPGWLYPINLDRSEVWGVKAYRDLASVPEQVDLALIAIPAAGVTEAIEDCAKAGITRVVIASSGFADAGAAGAALQRRVVADRAPIRHPHRRAQHARLLQRAGRHRRDLQPRRQCRSRPQGQAPAHRRRVAERRARLLALQSRPACDGLDFSSIVSIGNQGDLELADYADLLLDDADTKVVHAVHRGDQDARPIHRPRARRRRRCEKPLIVAKVGRFKAASRAVVLAHRQPRRLGQRL